MGIYSFLSDDKNNEIKSNIPNLNVCINYNVLGTRVNDLLNGTNISTALVCLDDATNRFHFIRMALFKAQAEMIWYLEMSPDAPDKTQAILAGKFYFDYMTQLMYAIGEDISFFIIHYLNNNFKEYFERTSVKKKIDDCKITSNAAKIGLYLSEEKKEHEITRIISCLHNNPNWAKSMKYRCTWVHDKPPIIEGLGNEFPRTIFPITAENDGIRNLSISSGVPQYSIDQLLDITLKATKALETALSDIVKMVMSDNQK